MSLNQQPLLRNKAGAGGNWPPPPARAAEVLSFCGDKENGAVLYNCRTGLRERVWIAGMSAFLNQIVAKTRRKVDEAKRGADLRELEGRAERHVPRGFRRALEEKSKDGVAVIAELKKASPSKGLIRAEFRVEELARELEAAGAAALSVLTDQEFFQGSLENLPLASAVVKVPCLRKDFIVDEFQLLEARANSADAVLLIVAALTREELTKLALGARERGLDVLCEVHDEDELQPALDAGCDLIGVNARDLRTFKVDVETLFRLVERIPKNAVRVAESGIGSGDDIARLRAAGYQAFLIGELLMRAQRPGVALRELVASCEVRVPSTQFRAPSGW
jgi:indole-3-glycerol phosphate synthase